MQHAFIKLTPNSVQQLITIEEVKGLFNYYQQITTQAGNQVAWGYSEAAFPYTILDTSNSTLHLTSDHDRYHSIYVGVGIEENEQSIIQISLPESATFGDKGKANEFCRFIAKKLEGELHLFNGRIMYFYKR